MIVSLIGPSAAGKSTVAQLIGRKNDYSIVDIDCRVSEYVGKPINIIFMEKGTEYVQAITQNIISDIVSCKANNITIIVVGAAAIQNPKIRNIIKRKSTLIIGLTARPEVLINRISASVKSSKHAATPLMGSETGRQFGRLLFEYREIFTHLANIVIDTSKYGQNTVAKKIIQAIDQYIINKVQE